MGARAAHSNTLPYVFLSGVGAFVLAGALWGILETEVVRNITGLDTWGDDSQHAATARDFIKLAWDWFLLLVVLRIGIEGLIAARLVSTSNSNAVVHTFIILVFHVFMVIFVFVIGELFDPLFDVLFDFENDIPGSFVFPLTFARDITFAYGPSLFLIASDLYYLFAPIRDDVFGRR